MRSVVLPFVLSTLATCSAACRPPSAQGSGRAGPVDERPPNPPQVDAARVDAATPESAGNEPAPARDAVCERVLHFSPPSFPARDVPPNAGPCKALHAEHRQRAAQVERDFGEGTLPWSCQSSERETWAVLVDRTAGASEGPYRVWFRVVHVARDGVSASAPLSPVDTAPRYRSRPGAGDRSIDWYKDMTDESFALATFDWDGDGSAELAVRTSVHFHEGGSWTGLEVFTFKSGRVEEYAPARDLWADAVDDVDRDGRPDLVYFAPFSADIPSPGSGFNAAVTGPLFIAHSRPDGTFARDDEVAKRALACSCPEATTNAFPIEPTRDESPEMVWMRSLGCARARGVPPARLIAGMARACADGGSPGSVCASRNAFRALAEANAPVHLR